MVDSLPASCATLRFRFDSRGYTTPTHAAKMSTAPTSETIAPESAGPTAAPKITEGVGPSAAEADYRAGSEEKLGDHTSDILVGPNGEQYPTEEELKTLHRTYGHVPWIIYTIAFVELCERFAYYGTTAVCK